MHKTPLPGHLAEALLLVKVVVTGGPRLDDMVVVQGLKHAIEVGHCAETQSCGIAGIHAGNSTLGKVRGGTQSELSSFVDQRFHDFRWIRIQLQAIDARFGC